MYRSSLVFLLENEKKITFKAVLDGETGVIVDKHSPQKFLQGYWYSDTPSGRGGRKFLALQGLIRQSQCSIGCPGVSGAQSAVPAFPALNRLSRRLRCSIGCPGVSGAQSAVPAIQMPRALRPVQSLIRVPSDEAFTSRSNVFSNPEEMTRVRKMMLLWSLCQEVIKTAMYENGVK